MIVARFRCERIERHSVAVLGRLGGEPNQERQTVVLGASPTTRVDGPNRKIWKGIAVGQIILGELDPELVLAELELHREYIVEIRAADLEPTVRGGVPK